MNILFLTLLGFNSINEHNLYTDLLSEFVNNGHHVYIVSPLEKRLNKYSYLVKEENADILRVCTGNIQKTGFIEKGVSTLTIESIFRKAIQRQFSNVKFDLILYSTPPITLVSVIQYIKKRDNAKTYLLLKDIFPQNAIDIGLLSKRGLKGCAYKYFRHLEKKLYNISDYIGCMSPANVKYILEHNADVDPNIVEVCPNSISIVDKSVDLDTRKSIRLKYDIPLDKKIFIYGGNLGKPQGIPFLIKCLKRCKEYENAYFLIVGDGTEYKKLVNYSNHSNQANLKILKSLPKEDFDTLVGACDIGMIFLDHRFTIPNFPSRLLSYMQARLPVIACTDPNTDIGQIIVDNGFGWWCESNNSARFAKMINYITKIDTDSIGDKSFNILLQQYSVKRSYQIIMKRISG